MEEEIEGGSQLFKWLHERRLGRNKVRVNGGRSGHAGRSGAGKAGASESIVETTVKGWTIDGSARELHVLTRYGGSLYRSI